MQEILWAPWRLSYIERPTTGKVDSVDIFVDLPAAGDDEKHLILSRGQFAFMMMNAFPYSTGHLLIAPYRKVSDIAEMNDDELLESQRLIQQGVRVLRSAFKPDAFNIGINMGQAAGAGIPQHIHWHVVPRWHGDTNFMSSIGNTKVIPQSLEDTFQRLKGCIGNDFL